jgi:hypothetical protein
LIDKKNVAKPITAESTNALIPKIQLYVDDPRYAGLRNDILRDRQGALINVYAKDSSWISAGDDILFLDIAKTRKYAQERGRITGKKIFVNRAGKLDWKPETTDFPKILNSVLKPLPLAPYGRLSSTRVWRNIF